jgi:hypothetical protein
LFISLNELEKLDDNDKEIARKGIKKNMKDILKNLKHVIKLYDKIPE